MNKKCVLWILLDLIFIIIFNVVFFVAGGSEHTASVWISYAFIHFAYIMVIATSFLIRQGKNAAMFGFSLYSISSVYFFIEFIVGVIFILLRSNSYKSSLLVQVIIAGFYAILLISHLIANENTADSVETHNSEVAHIKEAASCIKNLIGKAPDKRSNKAIERAYDALHSSPTKSTNSANGLESAILTQISYLKNAIVAGNKDEIIKYSDEIVSTVAERNRILQNTN